MAVAFDVSGSGADQSGSATPSVTISVTCTGSNRAMLAGIGAGQFGAVGTDAACATTLAYDAVSLTSLATRSHAGGGNHGYSEIFGLINPNSGTHNLVVTGSGWVATSSGNNALNVIVYTFNGVDQTTAFSIVTATPGNSGTASVSASGSVSGDLYACFFGGGSNFSTTSSATNRIMLNTNQSSACGTYAGHTHTATGTQTETGTLGADSWAAQAVRVIQSAAADTSLVSRPPQPRRNIYRRF